MDSTELSDRTIRTIRWVAASFGFLLLLVALLVDLLGLSAGSGFSGNQVAFAVAGFVFVIAGILGRRFPRLYKGTAVLFLNVIIVLILLEFMSLVIVKLVDNDRFSDRARKLEEGGTDILDRTVLTSTYVPWVIWRSTPSYPGDPVTVGEDGYRLTPGASEAPDAYRVFTFGGSAMWGSGVADSCTIAAYLQRGLEELVDCPVSVSNMGQNAHTSTQEIIELMLQLRSGNVPDFVVFYDGFNDVWAAYESGIAGVHHSFDAISARIEGREDPGGSSTLLQSLFRESNTWLLLTSLRDRGFLGTSDEPAVLRTYEMMGKDRDSLAGEVVSIYFQNCSLVEHLAQAYGFEFLIAWQPVIWCGDKHLTEHELGISNGTYDFYPAGRDSALIDLLEASYGFFDQSISDSLRYLSLAGIFDGVEETIYSDFSGVHVEPWANEMIAEELLVRLLELDLVLTGTADSHRSGQVDSR
jgi:hypothetical protein